MSCCCCCCCCVRLRVSQYVATATAPVVIVDEQVTWLYEVTDDSVRLMSLLSDCCTLREQDPPPGPKWGAHWAPASRAAVVEGSLLLETFPSISFSAQTGFIVAQPKREEVDEALSLFLDAKGRGCNVVPWTKFHCQILTGNVRNAHLYRKSILISNSSVFIPHLSASLIVRLERLAR